MRDVLDDEEGGFRPLSVLLLATAVILGGAITYNAMFRQHAETSQNLVANIGGVGAARVDVNVPVDAANTVVIKYDPLVEDVQRALLASGIYRGLVDGVNGQRTKLAIVQYQQANGLPVTGEVSKDLATHIQYTNTLKAASEFTGAVDMAPQAAPVSPGMKKTALQVSDESGKSELPVAAISKTVSLTPAINARLARIKRVQIALSSMGYKPGQVTGALNETTRSAILQFEMDHGLAMDGIIDAMLLQALQITAYN
jgi:peptidoglycan hydrolase-like protein with peptidoglycan-binding domain